MKNIAQQREENDANGPLVMVPLKGHEVLKTREPICFNGCMPSSIKKQTLLFRPLTAKGWVFALKHFSIKFIFVYLTYIRFHRCACCIARLKNIIWVQLEKEPQYIRVVFCWHLHDKSAHPSVAYRHSALWVPSTGNSVFFYLSCLNRYRRPDLMIICQSLYQR